METKLGVERIQSLVDVDNKEVEEQVARIAENARTYETKKGKAAKGDQVTFDYLGKVDGEPFEGGADKDSKLVLGSASFIPGFEDGLIGMKAGDTGTVKVKFPEDYNAAHLAGKDAEFDVTIKDIGKPGDLEINDELAKTLGLESLEQLTNVVRDQIVSQYGGQTRTKIKRQLLDALDKAHSFELPETMVDQEFDNIWRQISADLEQAGKTFEDEDTTEDEAKAEYRTLSERRVRLGLILAEIGEGAKVEVTEQELQQALYQQVQQYPGQEQEMFEFFKGNSDALGSLRAPIFEEKVVDHIIELADVSDKTVSKEDLMKDDIEEEAEAKAKTKKKTKAKAK
jgi:trigger factor